MSLSSASNIAKSGLNTVSAETSVLSRNVTGASDTATYSRKIANVISSLDGSRVASVTRASNLAVFGNLLGATSASATQNAISAGLETLNQTVGDVSSSSSSTTSNSTSPAALLSNFTNALQSYEASPSSVTLGQRRSICRGNIGARIEQRRGNGEPSPRTSRFWDRRIGPDHQFTPSTISDSQHANRQWNCHRCRRYRCFRIPATIFSASSPSKLASRRLLISS